MCVRVTQILKQANNKVKHAVSTNTIKQSLQPNITSYFHKETWPKHTHVNHKFTAPIKQISVRKQKLTTPNKVRLNQKPLGIRNQ
eukprot:gene2843-1828_t